MPKTLLHESFWNIYRLKPSLIHPLYFQTSFHQRNFFLFGEQATFKLLSEVLSLLKINFAFLHNMKIGWK